MEASVVEDEIRRVVSEIWNTTLHLPIEAADVSPDQQSVICAIVSISDAWQGTLLLAMEPGLVTLAARAFFALESSVTPTPAQLESVVKELLNVTAGNLKTVLPEPCTLGIPILVESDSEWKSQGDLLLKVAFQSCNIPLVVEARKL